MSGCGCVYGPGYRFECEACEIERECREIRREIEDSRESGGARG